MRVGTLNDPDRLQPDIHIYTSSKQPWVILPEGIPAYPEYYDLERHWPEERQVRLKALMDEQRSFTVIPEQSKTEPATLVYLAEDERRNI